MVMPLNISWKHATLLGVACFGIIFVFLSAPISQSQAYHHFADDRNFYGIPNFWNVVSNVPFMMVGAWGMVCLLRKRNRSAVDIGSLTFFAGILLTAFGSIWYHLHPYNHTMVWDRLPMTIAFMAFFSIVIRECMDKKIGKNVLFLLLFIGMLSVWYWHLTENRGHGDLRFYLLVQFLPMVLIPLILLLFKAEGRSSRYFWLILIAYVIAKVFESADAEVFTATGSISGHSIKHAVAALAPLIYLLFLSKKTIPKEKQT
jgi:hypothetical protein